MKSIPPRGRFNAATDYFIALGFVAMAVASTIFIREFISGSRFLLSVGAVALSTWYGGGRLGVFSALVASAAVNYFLLEPVNSFKVSPAAVANIALFLAVALLISWIETRRRNSERELREARDELRIILDGVADGITVQTADGVIIYANQAAAELTGYTSAETLVNTTPADRARIYTLLGEDDQVLSEDQRPRARVFSTGQTASRLLKLKFNPPLPSTSSSEDFRWIQLRTAPVFDERRQTKVAVNILRDVTERHNFEIEMESLAKLAESSRRRLDSIISNLPGMVYENEFDPATGQQRNTYISPYAVTMFGYDADRLKNDPDLWQMLVHPDDVPAMAEELGKQLAVGNTGRVTYRAFRSDGRLIYCEQMFTLLKDADGRPIGTAGLVLDVSERKLAEEEAKQFAEELRRSNAELEQFAYVASHDLQEPLRMITSYLQLIEQRFTGQLDSDAREFIGFAVDGAARMKSLIIDLLTYSRVQRAKLDFGLVSMKSVLDQATSNLKVTIDECQAQITSDQLPDVTANQGQMIQLMQNLIGNALKFRRELPPKIHISCEKGKTEWIFAVRDNGIGIEEEYKDRIFVIFQRLHGRDQHPGTGIGLAVCKKIIERHNGRIWVESKVGEGASFYFTLPFKMRKVTFNDVG
jgi:PAS domain S-box-containing protein